MEDPVKVCLRCIYLCENGCGFRASMSTVEPACGYYGTKIGLLTGTPCFTVVEWLEAAKEAARVAKLSNRPTWVYDGIKYYIPKENKQ